MSTLVHTNNITAVRRRRRRRRYLWLVVFNDLDGFFRRTLAALRAVAAAASAVRCVAGRGADPVAAAGMWLWADALLSVRASERIRRVQRIVVSRNSTGEILTRPRWYPSSPTPFRRTTRRFRSSLSQQASSCWSRGFAAAKAEMATGPKT